VIEVEAANLLQDVVRREGRSVLVYVGDSFPWATAREGPALDRLRGLIRAESDAINAIAAFLQRNRLPLTFHGSYPASFTAVNFLALKHLLPRLAAYERSSIPTLEADLARLHDPGCRTVVENLLAVKRANLSALEQMTAPQPQPAA
jgi:hypothetical protein